MLSNVNSKDTVQIDKYVQLILDVSNIFTLLENIHHIFHLISNPVKIPLLKNITKISILSSNVDLAYCKFLSPSHYESK